MTSHDTGLADRYEALRVSASASLERELFIRQGMPAWMQAWENSSISSDAVQLQKTRCRMDADKSSEFKTELPDVFRAQAVELLAGIAWIVLGAQAHAD